MKTTINTVFVLQHEYEINGIDHIKFIGVYSSYMHAQIAVKKLSIEGGFRDWKEGFNITEYQVDKTHWCEGFN